MPKHCSTSLSGTKVRATLNSIDAALANTITKRQADQI